MSILYGIAPPGNLWGPLTQAYDNGIAVPTGTPASVQPPSIPVTPDPIVVQPPVIVVPNPAPPTIQPPPILVTPPPIVVTPDPVQPPSLPGDPIPPMVQPPDVIVQPPPIMVTPDPITIPTPSPITVTPPPIPVTPPPIVVVPPPVIIPITPFVPPVGSPLATNARPRLLFTATDVTAIKTKLAAGSWLSEFQAWIDFLDANYSSVGTAENDWAANYAFAYATYGVVGVVYGHTRLEYGNKSRQVLIAGPAASPVGIPNINPGFPLAYDWIHDLLTDDDKASLIPWFKNIDAYIGNAINTFNAQIVGRRAVAQLCALAMYGDETGNVWSSANIANYLFDFRATSGVTYSNSAFSTTGGGGGQGFLYFSGDLEVTGAGINWMIYAEEAYRTANGISLAAHYGGTDTYIFRYHPVYLASMEVPWSLPNAGLSPDNLRHTIWKSWASTANDSILGNHSVYSALNYIVGMFATVNPDTSALGSWLLTNRVGLQNDVLKKKSALPHWIAGIKGLTEKTAAQVGVPLSFGRPDGMYFLRTGWADNDDSFVTYSAPKWSTSETNYTNGRPGGFEVYRKGPQVIALGYGGHDGANDRSTASGNHMIFPDRSVSPLFNDFNSKGGMRYQLDGAIGGAAKFINGTDQDLLTSKKDWLSDGTSNRDIDYISTTLTRAYASSEFSTVYDPARLSYYIREFVYFRPAVSGVNSDRIIIIDRIITLDTKYYKTWLFHTSTEPIPIGFSSSIAGPVRGATGIDGHVTYMNPSLITAVNTTVITAGTSPKAMNGKSWLTPLLPATRVAIKVGGPNGTTGLAWQYLSPANTNSHEFEEPYGRNTEGNPPPAITDPWVGHYRIELNPTTLALADVMLNALEVSDSDATQTPAILISGTNVSGVEFGNRIAIFSTSGDNISVGSFVIADANTYRIFIANLIPSASYTITVGGTPNVVTSTSVGTIYLLGQVVGTNTTVLIALT